jgi:hypothetical protein
MPLTRFCDIATPSFKKGDRLKFVSQNDSSTSIEGYTVINATDKYAGLYTGGMSYCVAVGAIEYGQKHTVNKLHLIHLAGGLTSEALQAFILKLTEHGTPLNNFELVICGGSRYSLSADVAHNTGTVHFEPSLAMAGVSAEFLQQFSDVHLMCHKSLVLTSNGAIGAFDYDGYRNKTSKEFCYAFDAFSLTKELELFQVAYANIESTHSEVWLLAILEIIKHTSLSPSKQAQCIHALRKLTLDVYYHHQDLQPCWDSFYQTYKTLTDKRSRLTALFSKKDESSTQLKRIFGYHLSTLASTSADLPQTAPSI